METTAATSPTGRQEEHPALAAWYGPEYIGGLGSTASIARTACVQTSKVALAGGALFAFYQVGGTLVNATRNAGFAIQDFANGSPALWRVLGVTRLAAAIRLPLGLYYMGKDLKTAFTSKDGEEVLEAALQATSSAGDLFDSTSTFCSGLIAIGAIAESSSTWIAPLMVVSAPLMAAGLVANSIGWYRTAGCLAEIDEQLWTGHNTTERLTGTLRLITGKDDAYLKRHFRIQDAGRFRQLVTRALDNIELQLQGEKDKATAQEDALDLIEQLKGRAKEEITSRKLSIVSTVICLIAIAFFFTPLAPVGFALCALVAMVSLYSLAHGSSKESGDLKLKSDKKDEG